MRNKKCLNPNLTCGTRIWGRSICYAFCVNLARNEKKGSWRKYQKPLIFLVGREGFEPSANGLKVRCSTAELTAHLMHNFKA